MIWDETKVQEYIVNQIEESLTLDYKAADAHAKSDGKKKEISKDVSAMANSSGGIIIYGIIENPNHKYFPEKIEPIDRKDFSKEWLEQVINSNIFPRIDGIIIHPISLSSGLTDILFVVEIPKSTTAHQAGDFRYYKRYNFESVPMYDYEVRDVMNRRKTPLFDLEIFYEIEERKIESRWPTLPTGSNNGGYETYKRFKVVITNKGLIISNYVVFEIKIPSKLLSSNNYQVSATENIGAENYSVIRYNNTVRDIVDVEINPLTQPSFKYGPSRYEPILPRLTFEKSISLETDVTPFSGIIYWTIYADDAEPKGGEIMIQDIKLLPLST